MAACFVAIAALPALRGPPLRQFVPLYFLAGVAYAVAVFCLGRVSVDHRIIWVFALLLRLILLGATPPTLSDDVYRYIWDGRLAHAGVSPYAFAVDSALLDAYDSPQRALVNNGWMASPYLPAAQALFAGVYAVAPDSPFAFQVVAVLFDLMTGWLVAALLRRLALPQQWVLIYLWNPLVIVEFAHGAHVDALMLCLMMAGLWAIVVEGLSPSPPGRRFKPVSLLSVAAMVGATLTKGIPALLLPVVVWRWGWPRTLLYLILVLSLLLPIGLSVGWGLTGPRDGEGLFGAMRIYGAQWNYNSGLYHWLEVELSGYRTPGAVPPEITGERPIRLAKLIAAGALGLVLLGMAWKARGLRQEITLLRAAIVPFAAYLLLTTTVHPWYVTVVIPLLPFLLPRDGEKSMSQRFLWPWLLFSVAVGLSYFTYLDPANLREYDWIRLAEYVPLYCLLIWAAWPFVSDRRP